MKVILAIPCYNCAPQIGRVLEELPSQAAQRLEKIILIDNRSTDQTVERAKEASAKLNGRLKRNVCVVVQNRENYGLGGSHKVAFRIAQEAGADYVGILHGDNQAKSEEVEQLFQFALNNPDAAAILGARFHPRSQLEGYSKIRTFGNFALNLLYSVFTRRLILDLGSGINLFRIRDLSDGRYLHFDNGFTFNMDLLLDYVSKKAKFKYLPITWREFDQVSNAKALSVGFKTLTKVVVWFFNRKTPTSAPANFEWAELSQKV